MIAYILKVTLCWIFFLGIYELFLRKKTFFNWNRGYLLSTLVLGMAIPLLEFISWKSDANISYVIYPVLSEIDQLQQVVQEKSEKSFNWINVLFIIYITGFLFSLIRLFFGFSKIFRLYKNGNKTSFSNYTLVKTETYHLPFSFFKWVFVSNKLKLTNEMNKVIAHEVEHIRGRHSLDVIFAELLKAIFWCSPMIYFYKKALREIHEFLADHTVAQNGRKIDYIKLLLGHSGENLQMALTHQFYNSHLKNRLKMINQKRSGRQSLVMYALGIPVLLVLFFAFTAAFGQQKENVGSSVELTNPTIVDSESTELLAKIGDYYMESDPEKAPYFQIEGKDIELPLFDHISLYGGIGNVTVMLPEDAVREFGEKAKLGYINFENPPLKYGESRMDLRSQRGLYRDLMMEGIKRSAENAGYEQGRINDKRKEVSSAGKNMIRTLMAGITDTIPQRKTSKEIALNEVYKEVDKMPRFPGCSDSDEAGLDNCTKEGLFGYIGKNLTYPQKAKENDIQGSVAIEFIITKEGSIENAKVVRDIGGDCGYAALDVIDKMKSLGNWTPAYKEGKPVNMQLTLPISFKLPPNSNTSEDEKAKKVYNEMVEGMEVFKVVEEMPRFPGCEDISDIKEREQCSMQKMLEFIYTNVKYPSEAREKGIEGMSVVQFVIMKDGSISDIEIIRDLEGGCGESAQNAVQSMVDQGIKWIPGKQRGKNVNVEFKLPVKFKLEGNSKEKKDKSEEIKEEDPKLYGEIDANKAYIQVNGKEWTKSLDDINPDDIQNIDVRSPEWSIKEFGDKAKEGSIIITLKNNSLSGKKAGKEVDNTIKLKSNGLDPLYVIDGEVLDVSLKEEDLDPDDIAEINVLKGEAALKKYGDKAQNGVIEIYTKAFRKKYPSKDTKVEIKRKGKKDGSQDDSVIKMVDAFVKTDKALEGLDLIDDDNIKVKEEVNSLKLEEYKVYPNPGSEFVKVQFKADKLPTTIQIVDQSGKVIFTRNIDNFKGVFDEQITLQEHVGGPAILRVIQGDKVFVDKLILN